MGIVFLLIIFVVAVVNFIVGNRPANAYSYFAGSELVGLCVTLFFFLITMWCFYLAAVTDPGSVKKEFPWDPLKTNPAQQQQQQQQDEETAKLIDSTRTFRGIEKRLDGRSRFCKWCNTYKPDRTHHCKKLGRCVLEMDHWCGWIRNTVGFYNKKYFFLLLFYGSVTLCCYLLTLGPFLPNAIKVSNALDFFVVFAFILAGMEYCLLTAFLGFHVYLALFAYTTIEYKEKRGAKEVKVNKQGVKIRDLYAQSPYDLGFAYNLSHLLGHKKLFWLVPLRRFAFNSDPNEGLIYKINSAHELVKSLESEALMKNNTVIEKT